MKLKPAPLPPITRAAGTDPRTLLDKINELVAEVNRLRDSRPQGPPELPADKPVTRLRRRTRAKSHQ